MGEPWPYAERDRRRAINGAAVLGWCAVMAWFLWDARDLPPAQLRFVLPFVAIIGLPTAFAACWFIGAPLLSRMARGSLSYARAALWGGGSAALMAAASIAMGRILGWLESMDDDQWSRIGWGEFVESVDGILTPYGWFIVAQNSAILVGIGAVIGVVLRATLGPGRGSNNQTLSASRQQRQERSD